MRIKLSKSLLKPSSASSLQPAHVLMLVYSTSQKTDGRRKEKKGDKATGQSVFNNSNSASWKLHSVPHLRNDTFSAEGGGGVVK